MKSPFVESEDDAAPEAAASASDDRNQSPSKDRNRSQSRSLQSEGGVKDGGKWRRGPNTAAVDLQSTLSPVSDDDVSEQFVSDEDEGGGDDERAHRDKHNVSNSATGGRAKSPAADSKRGAKGVAKGGAMGGAMGGAKGGHRQKDSDSDYWSIINGKVKQLAKSDHVTLELLHELADEELERLMKDAHSPSLLNELKAEVTSYSGSGSGRLSGDPAADGEAAVLDALTEVLYEMTVLDAQRTSHASLRTGSPSVLEWRMIAMVVDRLCFMLFLLLVVGLTLFIFWPAI